MIAIGRNIPARLATNFMLRLGLVMLRHTMLVSFSGEPRGNIGLPCDSGVVYVLQVCSFPIAWSIQ